MSVSEDDVLWCYRELLGREPESADAMQEHLQAIDFRSLVARFLKSAEFASAQHGKPDRDRHPLALPRDKIDVEASPEQLAACLERIKATWTHLGAVKPHFSVLTEPRYMPQRLKSAERSFWKSGEEEADDLFKLLRRHAFGPPAQRVAVEFGCGVGRMTLPLARHFAHVHAYDISAEHLALAGARATDLGVHNISLHECSANMLAGLEPCDFLYSRIVFQHNPPPVIFQLVRNALNCLKPGGLAIFQVPTYCVGYSFNLEAWLKAELELKMEMHCLPQRHIFRAIAREKCLTVEVREDDSTGAPDRYLSNVFVVRKRTGPGQNLS